MPFKHEISQESNPKPHVLQPSSATNDLQATHKWKHYDITLQHQHCCLVIVAMNSKPGYNILKDFATVLEDTKIPVQFCVGASRACAASGTLCRCYANCPLNRATTLRQHNTATTQHNTTTTQHYDNTKQHYDNTTQHYDSTTQHYDNKTLRQQNTTTTQNNTTTTQHNTTTAQHNTTTTQHNTTTTQQNTNFHSNKRCFQIH